MTILGSLLFAGCLAAVRVQPAIAFQDGCEPLETNPARGLATGGWVTFAPEGIPDWHGTSGYHSSLWELRRFQSAPLTEAMKGDVRRFLQETREAGGALIVRLGYTQTTETGCEPKDFELVLDHVRTLAEILRDFAEVVVGVEAGVAGPWGEMHSSDYCQPEYMRRILKTYVDNLGPHIPLLVRAPKYFDCLMAKDRARLGMFNDGYLGTWEDYGTWIGDCPRERGCRTLKALDRVPYGGELAYISRDWLENNRTLFDRAKWNLVEEWYSTHLNYLRNLEESGHTLAEFLKNDLVFRAREYAFTGAPNLGEYDGLPMRKFLKDHMGYRFVVRGVRQAGEKLEVEIENTGFGRVLLPYRVAVVGKGFARRVDGVSLPEGGTRRTLTVPMPPKGGPVGLRVWCPCQGEVKLPGRPKRPIRFANADCWSEALQANFIAE